MPGPPGAPGGVRVMNKTEKNVTLQWSRGADNHSPISKYAIQYRDAFSKDAWKNATTCTPDKPEPAPRISSFKYRGPLVSSAAPPDVEGNAETAIVVDLFPWTEYEFRVIAANTLGAGEPSSPSPKEKTLEAGEETVTSV